MVMMILCLLFFSFFSLKTSLFKWNPDLDGAAAEYAKAGL